MPIINRITGIEGLTAGGNVTVTVNLPVDRRYLALKLFATINAVAAAVTDVVDRVRLMVNGRSIWDVSAARYLQLVKLHGITPATGELPLYFAEPARADKIDEIATAWDLRGESTFQVQIVVKGLAEPTDVPGLVGIAVFDYGVTTINGKPAKLITRLLELTKNAASGLNDFDNLPTNAPILGVYLDGSANITEVYVKNGGDVIAEMTSAQNARVLADYGADPTQFRFPLRFDFREQITDTVAPIPGQFNVRFASASAQTVTALVHQITGGFN